jgi:hypothetical protein
VFIGVETSDDSTEDHVNGGSEERGGDEDEHVLNGIRHDLVGFAMGTCADAIPDHLDYDRLLENKTKTVGEWWQLTKATNGKHNAEIGARPPNLPGYAEKRSHEEHQEYGSRRYAWGVAPQVGAAFGRFNPGDRLEETFGGHCVVW